MLGDFDANKFSQEDPPLGLSSCDILNLDLCGFTTLAFVFKEQQKQWTSFVLKKASDDWRDFVKGELAKGGGKLFQVSKQEDYEKNLSV